MKLKSFLALSLVVGTLSTLSNAQDTSPCRDTIRQALMIHAHEGKSSQFYAVRNEALTACFAQYSEEERNYVYLVANSCLKKWPLPEGRVPPFVDQARNNCLFDSMAQMDSLQD